MPIVHTCKGRLMTLGGGDLAVRVFCQILLAENGGSV